MNVLDIITKKRGMHGKFEANTKEEIEYIISSYVEGAIPDYQMASYLMAIYLNGMNVEEISYLTNAMLHSGEVIDLSSIRRENEVFVDKHSTGGVGDKISLPLAAIVATCGVRVPMMAGRALGYTGGTLDKLEAIEGYRTALSVEEFKNTIDKIGFAIMGQTERIAPADRLLYALRDVTGTVESIPLITSSILSKKVAEGADAFCFDVKAGTGAFMKNIEDASSLAKSLVNTSKNMGKKAVALITDMNIPLGRKIGNFLEIEESLDVLENRAPLDVMELTRILSAHMIYMGGASSSYESALKKTNDAIESGQALECFIKNVEAQGGNAKLMMKQRGAEPSEYSKDVLAREDGYISTFDALTCGRAGVKLGVGREKKTDAVSRGAGITIFKSYGEKVIRGEPVMRVYGKNENSIEEALVIIQDAITYSPNSPEKRKLIYEIIS